jgi:transcription elongation factor GreA
MTKIAVTKSGLKKMEEEIFRLKGKEMREALEALSEAREKGDISENSEYEVAKQNIDMLNIKIQSLEERYRNTVVVSKDNISTDTVQLFTKVKVQNIKTKKELLFTIVTDDEVDVKSGKISQNSPIAKGLIGNSKGKKVKIDVPAGQMEFKIIDISLD